MRLLRDLPGLRADLAHLVASGFILAFATFVAFAWRDRTEYRISAEEVARIDRKNRSVRRAALAQLGAAE